MISQICLVFPAYCTFSASEALYHMSDVTRYRKRIRELQMSALVADLRKVTSIHDEKNWARETLPKKI